MCKNKLIERAEKTKVVCDNPSCDYSIECDEEFIILFVDAPCEKCGDNLLTIEDWVRHERLMKVINFINFWFSWITFFYSKKALENRGLLEVNIHDGMRFTRKVTSFKS